MNILTIYPNCSLGGMTSVYINRCLDQPNDIFNFIFLSDKGGREAFTILSNTNTRILRRDRLNNYLDFLVEKVTYDEIRITSMPSLPKILKRKSDTKIVYEFHTSSLDIISRELDELSLESVDEIWVPSNYLKSIIESSSTSNLTVKVIRNLANGNIFNTNAYYSNEYTFPSKEIPIFWIGRFDKGKNYKDFFRVLSLLDEKYIGYIILSMENNVERYSEALGELAIYNLGNRVKFFLNLTQQEIADMYKASTSVNGLFCSTSLAESFGYGVLEAAMTGLPVVAYDVGALSEHLDYGHDVKMINVGDTVKLAEAVSSIEYQDI